MPTPPWSKRSLAVQALGAIEPETRAVGSADPVATTFIRDPDNRYPVRAHLRPTDNPRWPGRTVIAALEGGGRGAAVRLRHGGRDRGVPGAPPGAVVAPQVMYWAFRDWLATSRRIRASRRLRRHHRSRRGARRDAARRHGLVWIETPGNPLWTITDIAAAAEIAHAAGAGSASTRPPRRRCLPGRSRSAPTSSCISATKYLNGHSDVIAGALDTRANDPFWARIQACARAGAMPGPSKRGC